ncbi:glycosyltransferase family A protein [Thalassotalea mangrovi]|uniref:Glycosyltransferase family 2 protein n=1 Tax=Thalassotalea mangrovi TaxID=2572245 RepID=A0A4U1B4X7_9GAMM|nr:glycosyltransferase family A protein [Thalassotalea mangrovi]TKB45347.1 glycosyltransferase family 2 protein [Thalassotalea mangrovi]
MEINVTVVIPFFVKNEVFVQVLESVFTQSVKPKQLIMPRGVYESPEFRPFKSHWQQQNIQVFDNELSTADAMSFAVKVATGRYITFVERQEYWLPDKLKDQYQFLQDHPSAGSVYSGASSLTDILYKSKPQCLAASDMLINNVSAPENIMLRTSLFDKVCRIEPNSEHFIIWDLGLQMMAANIEQYSLRHLCMPLKVYDDGISKRNWCEYRRVLLKNQRVIENLLGVYEFQYYWYWGLKLTAKSEDKIKARIVTTYATAMMYFYKLRIWIDRENEEPVKTVGPVER